MDDLLKKLGIKDNASIFYQGTLTDMEVYLLTTGGYKLKYITCPCGNWNNERCKCSYNDLLNFVNSGNSGIMISKHPQ